MPHEHNPHEHHGNSGNGFILGVIVGAIIVYLLISKKGKKILNVLTENGFDGLSEITDLFSDEDELDEEENYTANGQTASPQSKPVRPLKRFFRGIRK